jgi:hypothetical protein
LFDLKLLGPLGRYVIIFQAVIHFAREKNAQEHASSVLTPLFYHKFFNLTGSTAY